jgi:hypothetical protein
VESEIPGREPRVFPRVRHLEYVERIELPPSAVAATARYLGFSVLVGPSDEAHFRRVPDLEVRALTGQTSAFDPKRTLTGAFPARRFCIPIWEDT